MSAAVWAGVVLAVLVLFCGSGSESRLRPPVVRPGPRRGWSPVRRPSYAGVGLDVPAGLALELRAGRDLAGAFAAMAGELADQPDVAARLEAAADAVRSGRRVASALSSGDVALLDDELRTTAACCDAATGSGLPLADVLDTVADAARSRAALLHRARAELAGARSTSVVLACLPVAGLAMGQLLGARPVHALLDTGWGLGCLAVAVVLTGAGLTWSRLIEASVRRRLP